MFEMLMKSSPLLVYPLEQWSWGTQHELLGLIKLISSIQQSHGYCLIARDKHTRHTTSIVFPRSPCKLPFTSDDSGPR